jgi:DNA-directed RNA polymerase specialized sigma24 family protein
MQREKVKSMFWLKEVDKYRDDWFRMASSFVGNEVADDIIQETYLKLFKYSSPTKVFFEDGRINKSYVYLTIRSICYELNNFKNKVQKTPFDDYKVDIIDEENIKLFAYNRLLDKIDLEVASWRWYDKQLFTLYKNSPMSLRTISKETGISWVSIYHTIKDCKAIIKEKFSEDYEDYLNGDYHLI